MPWAQLLAYVTGTLNQELLSRNEYMAAEKFPVWKGRARKKKGAIHWPGATGWPAEILPARGSIKVRGRQVLGVSIFLRTSF